MVIKDNEGTEWMDMAEVRAREAQLNEQILRLSNRLQEVIEACEYCECSQFTGKPE